MLLTVVLQFLLTIERKWFFTFNVDMVKCDWFPDFGHDVPLLRIRLINRPLSELDDSGSPQSHPDLHPSRGQALGLVLASLDHRRDPVG